jgi:hypothetical protein
MTLRPTCGEETNLSSETRSASDATIAHLTGGSEAESFGIFPGDSLGTLPNRSKNTTTSMRIVLFDS